MLKFCASRRSWASTLGIPASLGLVMSAKLTEAMTISLPETKSLTLSLKAEDQILKKVKISDVVSWARLSQHPETQSLITG